MIAQSSANAKIAKCFIRAPSGYPLNGIRKMLPLKGASVNHSKPVAACDELDKATESLRLAFALIVSFLSNRAQRNPLRPVRSHGAIVRIQMKHLGFILL